MIYRIFASVEHPHTNSHPHPQNCKENDCGDECLKMYIYIYTYNNQEKYERIKKKIKNKLYYIDLV